MKQNKTAPLLIIVLIAILPFSIFAQNSNQTKQRNFDNYVTIGITPTFNNKVKFDNQAEAVLKSKGMFSGEFHVGYHHVWKNSWGFEVNTGVGILPLNVYCLEEVPENAIIYPYFSNIDINYSDYDVENAYFSLDALCVKQFTLDEKNRFNLNLGLRMYCFLVSNNWSSYGATYGIPENEDVSIFTMKTYHTPCQRLNASLLLKPGYSRKLRNNDIVNISLVFNYSPLKRLTNDNSGYYFYGVGFDSYGTASQGVNFIGLSIEYGISCF